jgi:hypothetical protein
MGAILTYHVRAGQLTAVAAGRVFNVPTDKDPSRLGPLLRAAPSKLSPTICVVVLRQWDDLVRAVASEPELSSALYC